MKSLNTLFNKMTERLAIGRKVNQALDNPTAFFTAKSLSNRAGISRVLDNIGNNLSTVRAAEVGILSLERLVQVA